MRIGPMLMTAALAGTMLVAACSDRGEDKAGGDGSAGSESSGASVDIQGDSESGEIAIKIPGGIEANFKIPENIVHDTKVDIDGVGLYPGATIRGVNANIGDKPGRAVVTITFASAADAAVVADWYQQQFADNKVKATRAGETMTGKTGDGDDFTLALTPADAGSQGKLTIVNRHDRG